MLVWRYDLCSGSAHEMCGRAGGGASATARDGRAGDDRFVEPRRRETAAQVIRPRMPEKLNRLAASVSVLSLGSLGTAGLWRTV